MTCWVAARGGIPLRTIRARISDAVAPANAPSPLCRTIGRTMLVLQYAAPVSNRYGTVQDRAFPNDYYENRTGLKRAGSERGLERARIARCVRCSVRLRRGGREPAYRLSKCVRC